MKIPLKWLVSASNISVHIHCRGPLPSTWNPLHHYIILPRLYKQKKRYKIITFERCQTHGSQSNSSRTMTCRDHMTITLVMAMCLTAVRDKLSDSWVKFFEVFVDYSMWCLSLVSLVSLVSHRNYCNSLLIGLPPLPDSSTLLTTQCLLPLSTNLSTGFQSPKCLKF